MGMNSISTRTVIQIEVLSYNHKDDSVVNVGIRGLSKTHFTHFNDQ